MTEPRIAGRVLDAEIAERVTGLKPCAKWRYANLGSAGGPVSMNDGCEHGSGGCYPSGPMLPFSGPPHYSTNIAAAWTVIDAMMRASAYSVELFVSHESGGWRCEVDLGQSTATADTAPLAICLAALASVR